MSDVPVASSLESLLMAARSAIRQSTCPGCNRSGYRNEPDCDTCRERTALCEQLLSFPRPSDETTADGWQPIETAPKDGRTLLLGHFNSAGKWRTLRGQWYSWDQINEEWEEPENGHEGWYETSVENDDPPNCWSTEPTHWMPTPPPPIGAQKTSGSGSPP